VKVVGRDNFFRRLVLQSNTVALGQAEDVFGFQRALEVDVQLGLGQSAG
jgi:hypothetical protein